MALPTTADFLAQARGLFEPQRKYNFAVEFFLVNQKDQENITLAVETFQLPSEKSEVISLHYGNVVRYVAGKTSFAPRQLVLKDFVSVGTANALVKWRQKVYQPLTDAMGFAMDYKTMGTVVLVGPDGTHERYWDLIGCWPAEVSYGDLSQSDVMGTVQITVSMIVDKAIPRVVPQLSVNIALPT